MGETGSDRPPEPGPSRRVHTTALYGVFFGSGVAALGYEVVCTRMLALGIGHELPATLAVVTAFLGGIALGAWTLERLLIRNARPTRWYAVLESLIAVWALVSTMLIPTTSELALRWIGLAPSPWRHWTIAFCVPFVVLLPATAAMGATLPVMQRILAPLSRGGRCIGGIYAANTVGAVVGALVSVFYLMPSVGFTGTLTIFAIVNLMCAAVALRLDQPVESSVVDEHNAQEESLSRRRLLATIFLTGFLAIGFEVLIIRALSQTLENTIYSFATVLAVFLAGSAGGAALYQRFASARWTKSLLSWLLVGAASSCLVGVFAVEASHAAYRATRDLLGDSPTAVASAELLVTASVLLLPTVFMGGLFSLLVEESRRSGSSTGRALAVNTIGGAIAPLLVGLVALSQLGVMWSLIAISVSYLALLPRLDARITTTLILPLGLAMGVPSELRPMRDIGTTVEVRESTMATVSVVEVEAPLSKRVDDHRKHLYLEVNQRFQMGGTAAVVIERRQAHLPLLLHPAPKRALFLGVGTAITMGAVTVHPGLHADGVEVIPEILELLKWFAPHNGSPTNQPRLRLHAADARRFVRVSKAKYDVIVSDLFHPGRDGAGALYTVEHFAHVRDCLNTGGLFCQWLPLYQLDEQVLKIIIRSFMEAFPKTSAYLLRLNVDAPVLGLIAGTEKTPRTYPHDWYKQRVTDAPLRAQLRSVGLNDDYRIFGCLVADDRTLKKYCSGAPLNTDDFPRVAFKAPHFTARRSVSPDGRLWSLLNLHETAPEHLVADPMNENSKMFVQRLAGYITARNAYLQGLVADRDGRRNEALDLYIESARRSELFTAGYAQCLVRANALRESNPEAARRLLKRLIEAQPARPVARSLLRSLFGQ